MISPDTCRKTRYDPAVEWQNYRHLLSFSMVVGEGSVTRANDELRLGRSTVGAQRRALGESLWEELFRRVGRNLVPTGAGAHAASASLFIVHPFAGGQMRARLFSTHPRPMADRAARLRAMHSRD